MLRRQDNTEFQIRWYTLEGDDYLVTCGMSPEGDPTYYVHELEMSFSSDAEAFGAIEDLRGDTIVGEGPAEYDAGASEASGLEM